MGVSGELLNNVKKEGCNLTRSIDFLLFLNPYNSFPVVKCSTLASSCS